MRKSRLFANRSGWALMVVRVMRERSVLAFVCRAQKKLPKDKRWMERCELPTPSSTDVRCHALERQNKCSAITNNGEQPPKASLARACVMTSNSPSSSVGEHRWTLKNKAKIPSSTPPPMFPAVREAEDDPRRACNSWLSMRQTTL